MPCLYNNNNDKPSDNNDFKISEYIINNPLNWKDDRFYKEIKSELPTIEEIEMATTTAISNTEESDKIENGYK